MSVTSNSKPVSPGPSRRFPTGHEVIDHTFFLSESEFQRARGETRYDIFIIGSGFCALVVAERALKNYPACKILILERGTFLVPDHIQNLPPSFAGVLSGLETIPWTFAAGPAQGKSGGIQRVHGTIPFFGGCSTLWSGWCPRPTLEEMHGWPEETKRNVQDYFQSAEELLHVQRVDTVDSTDYGTSDQRPVYGLLQKVVGELIENVTEIENILRAEPASLASGSRDVNLIDFRKFSVPGGLLALASREANEARDSGDGSLRIALGCAVEEIHHKAGNAIALKTTRGVVQVGDAQLVLAMGNLPATTLVRNSFSQHDVREQVPTVGDRFSAHFISCIIARIPRGDLGSDLKFGDLEIGAFYVAGAVRGDYRRQFHIQIAALPDKDPDKNAQAAHRYMPDPFLTASKQQLETSKDHVIFACGVMGELDADNDDNWFRHNPDDPDTTSNSILQVSQNANDRETWDAMDEATFKIIERALSPKGAERVQYWHGPPGAGSWESQRPGEPDRRIDFLAHDGSTLYIGGEQPAPVDLNYRLRGTENVYVTGGGLWPRGGSWNPTMTMVALAQHLADKLTDKTKQD